jgi:acylpyruvate hydrolase
MKLATFKIKGGGGPTVGALLDELYVDLAALTDVPKSMLDFLWAGDAAMRKARSALEGVGTELKKGTPDKLDYVYRPDEIELMAPVPRPGKIVHTAVNFPAHLEELTKWKEPEWQSHDWKTFSFEHPTGFLQAPSSVSASGAKVEPPHFTKQLDYEVEVATIIGKEAFRVGVDEALDYVAGFTIFNDLSARDIQAREHSNRVIYLGKSFNGSCPLGPYLVTKDEIDDPLNLSMKLLVNGEVRQDSNTSQMRYKFADMVSWWSNTTLEPGDVITSGSPPGVAAGMDKPRWLQPGDTVEAVVEGLGTLTTYIV